jgi:Uma2 family endonuclease
MHVTLTSLPRGTIIYPDSDGKPRWDNTKQARWILKLYGNLSALFFKRADVFVAYDLLWYPVEGDPTIRSAPDVLAAFGRPKGDRGSYKQFEEDGVPVTVAFEVLSPNTTPREMADKLSFYTTYGVEEYYVYGPDANRLQVYVRQGTELRRVHAVDGFVSPRLGIRFILTKPEMTVHGPDGRRFITFEELEEQRVQAQRQADEAKNRTADAEKRVADAEKRATQARERAQRLAEQLRALGVEPPAELP